MQKVTRQEIFTQAAKKLRQEFQELMTIPHAGLKGGEAEELVRRFLRDHLPKRFDVGAAFIIDPNDNISKQTDLIIYDALNCPVYRASDRAAIIPSNNVAAVVEVKSQLDKERMQDAFTNANAVKGLAKAAPAPETPTLVTAQTLCSVFAFDTPLTLAKLAEHYATGLREHALGRHVDIVMVLDKGVIMLAGKPPLPAMDWAPLMLEGFGGEAGEGAHIAVATIATKEGSLDMFLRFLLAQLMHFRPLVGHPGFWVKQQPQPMMELTYLTSLTNERDPTRRAETLRQYEEQVRADFARRPVPPAKEPADRREPLPEVIHLPPPPEP